MHIGITVGSDKW